MVTHDQAEAMTLADRIVVMNDRNIQQVGSPMEIYARPANAFVARFVGSPAMTLAPGDVLDDGEFVQVRLGCGAVITTMVLRDGLTAGTQVDLGVRPECVTVVALGNGIVDAEVILVERLGDRTFVYALLSDGLEVIATDSGDSRIKLGDKIGLNINGQAAHIFGPDGAGHHATASA